MKSERRHNLETNTLAAELSKWIEQLSPHLNKILIGVAVVLVLMVLNGMWGAHIAQSQQDAWDKYLMSSDTSDPEMMDLYRLADSEDYAGSRMGEWAYLRWADRQVLLASQSYLGDREGAMDRLRRVEKIVEELAKNAGDRPVRERATFSLARIYELQNKIDEAIAQYSLVRGDMQPLAEERVAELRQPEVRESIAWLATVELPRRDLSGLQGTPGLRPGFDATPPRAEGGGGGIDTSALEAILGLENETEQEEAASGEGDETASDADSGSEGSETDIPATESPATEQTDTVPSAEQ